jgi:signal transduction histidine kinase
MQESLTNVARHSGANNVKVRLAENNETIVLSIKDDGKGFAEHVDTGKRTLGILGMKERAAEIGGIYTIEGEPGKGTLVSVSIPNPQYSTIQNEPL